MSAISEKQFIKDLIAYIKSHPYSQQGTLLEEHDYNGDEGIELEVNPKPNLYPEGTFIRIHSHFQED